MSCQRFPVLMWTTIFLFLSAIILKDETPFQGREREREERERERVEVIEP